MIAVGITMRVTDATEYRERRDTLDQRWLTFLERAELTPVLLPNHLPTLKRTLALAGLQGLVLTGGNTPGPGSDAPERDEAERYLLGEFLARQRPVLGVCRGMQALQLHFGVRLEAVEGHVAPTQTIEIDGRRQTVNSYHRLGARSSPGELTVWAKADDGIIKAVRNDARKIIAVMWHPERIEPFRKEDVALFREHFHR